MRGRESPIRSRRQAPRPAPRRGHRPADVHGAPPSPGSGPRPRAPPPTPRDRPASSRRPGDAEGPRSKVDGAEGLGSAPRARAPASRCTVVAWWLQRSVHSIGSQPWGADIHDRRAGVVEFSLEVMRDPGGVAAARHAVRRRLEGVLDSEVLDDALLALSELTANAVLHGKGRITLTMRVDGRGVRGEVVDEGPASSTRSGTSVSIRSVAGDCASSLRSPTAGASTKAPRTSGSRCLERGRPTSPRRRSSVRPTASTPDAGRGGGGGALHRRPATRAVRWTARARRRASRECASAAQMTRAPPRERGLSAA